MDYDPDLDWRVIEDAGFNTHIGPLMSVRPNETTWRMALRIEPKHLNTGGVCHGGVYMTMADVSMGVAAYQTANRQACATIDFQSHFLAAAKRGQWLVSESRVNRMVSGLVFMECALWADGRQCMAASGIWKLLNKPSVGRA